MHALIEVHRAAIAQLCRRHGVHRLDVFGSAAGEGFDPQRSDVDLLVDFAGEAKTDLFSRYFDLKESIEQLLGRPVDLVMDGASRNPHFLAAVQRSRQPLYDESAHAEAA